MRRNSVGSFTLSPLAIAAAFTAHMCAHFGTQWFSVVAFCRGDGKESRAPLCVLVSWA